MRRHDFVNCLMLCSLLHLVGCDATSPVAPALSAEGVPGSISARQAPPKGVVTPTAPGYVSYPLELQLGQEGADVYEGALGECTVRVVQESTNQNGVTTSVAWSWEIEAPDGRLVRLAMDGAHNSVRGKLVGQAHGALLEPLETQADGDVRTEATAIEYGLIAALVAVVIITGLTALGTSLDGKFDAVATTVSSSAPGGAQDDAGEENDGDDEDDGEEEESGTREADLIPCG